MQYEERQQQHCKAQYEIKQARRLKQQVATGVGTLEWSGGEGRGRGGGGSKQASPHHEPRQKDRQADTERRVGVGWEEKRRARRGKKGAKNERTEWGKTNTGWKSKSHKTSKTQKINNSGHTERRPVHNPRNIISHRSFLSSPILTHEKTSE